MTTKDKQELIKEIEGLKKSENPSEIASKILEHPIKGLAGQINLEWPKTSQ